MPRATQQATETRPELDPAITEGSKTMTAPGTESKSLALQYDTGDLGTGFEGTTAEDFAVPFLAILQKNSPQVEDGNPRRIEGAKAGMIMNTVTGKLYDGKVGIRFIPVHRERSFLEWIPRDQGGGFVAPHDPNSEEVQKILKAAGKRFGKLKIGDDNDLQETFSLFGGLVSDDGTSFDRDVISFASTQIGAYRKLMTTAEALKVPGEDGRMKHLPLFAHIYRLKTEFTTKKSYTWYKWVISFDGPDAESCRVPADSALYEEAKQFRALLMAGRARAAYETASQESNADESDSFEM